MIGKLYKRSALETKESLWSIGGETLDRNYADYHAYKQWLGPLGAKRIRLQAGWARTEAVPGRHEFDWLDRIVDDAISRGVQPWMELSYGNPAYSGGGDAQLAGGIPHSTEALEAWDRWVEAMVLRYRDRVHEWEIWNEVDHKDCVPVKGYVDLYLRSAAILRRHQPEARLWALALAGDVSYAEEFVSLMKAAGKLDLVDAITFHGYPPDPDCLRLYHELKLMMQRQGVDIPLRQGETGAPSQNSCGALRDLDWTPLQQAKWNSRRLIVHAAREIPMNLFAMADMHYNRPDALSGLNPKGLIECRSDLTAVGPKPAYTAAQHVFSVFNLSVRPEAGLAEGLFPAAPERLRVHGFVQEKTGARFVAYWLGGAQPEASEVRESLVFSEKAGMKHPVWVDLLTGEVHLPEQNRIPLWDGPLLLAEVEALDFEPLEDESMAG
ncbi:MAG: hypothetical protein HC904_13325 [Blastochloris sp.]|nr:hypothetical protein [Blastochloris sp.]